MKRITPLILLFITSLLFGQNHRIFRTLTVKDGLSQSEVTGITQDRYGFIWLSTNYGLNRYNGYEVVIYNQDKGGKYEMPCYAFNSVTKSDDGSLWVAGDEMMRLDAITEKFEVIPNVPKARNLQTDYKNNLWFISYNYNDPCFLDASKKTVKTFTYDAKNKQSIRGRSAGSIFINDRDVWISYNDIAVVDRLPLEEFYITNKSEAFVSYSVPINIKEIFSINNQVYFVDKTNVLYKYDRPSDKIVLLNSNFINTDISSVISDATGNIWIASLNKGLFQCSPTFNIINHFHIKNSSLPSNQINKLFADSSGVLWMATANGVVYTDLFTKAFRTYRYQPGMEQSLPDKSVGAIVADNNGIIWASTDNGFSFIDDSKDQITGMNGFSSGTKNFLSGSKLSDLEYFTNGLVFGAGKGVTKISLSANAVSYAEQIKDVTCLTVHLGKTSGYLWIGTLNSGLLCYPIPETYIQPGDLSIIPERMVQYTAITELSKEAIWAIHEDSKGVLWIGSSLGLLSYNPKENISEVFVNDPKNPSSLSHNSIKCIYEDSNGYLWIGTEAAGVNMFNKTSKKFQPFTTANGLVNNSVAGIVEDKNGKIWISTRNGLSCLDPVSGLFQNYDYSDGLPSNEFNYLSYSKTEDGRLCFGTTDGLVVFDPSLIKDNPLAPKTIITKLNVFNDPVEIGQKVNGNVILQESLLETEKIVLTHRNKVISFEFIGIHYAAPEMIQYEYLLEGFDKEWRKTNAGSRVANYTNLPAGNYTFKVRTYNFDGIFDESKDAQLKVVVLPPWWNRWWFRIFMFILISGLIFGGVRARIRQVELQKQRLQELVDEQTVEIRQKAEVLREVNETLITQQKELQETNVLLEEKHEEIMAQKEEIENQANELRKANATKDKFFSIIGHDLKNPMYAINGLAKMLNEGGTDFPKDQLKEIYQMLDQSSGGVTALLENLLTWARTQSGRVEFRPESFDLCNIVNPTLQILQVNAENKGLKLISEVPIPTMVYADSNMITTVVRNLINNAIKFTSKGSITVKTELFEGKIKVSIVDTGIGMSEEVRKKLFRIDTTHSTQGTSGEGGTGLGLVICKEFVDINKGNIWVESNPGEGSSFIFTLPVSIQ